jgi:glycerol-3-phosphate dehydrogenase
MKRDLLRLAGKKFDVIVIGGGVQGAAIVRRLACSGLKTALIEQNDFSGSTSANSLKILHGGLRYLQHLNFKRMRESIASRRKMMKIAPDLVRPLHCIMPLYKKGFLKSKQVLFAALFLNDLISFDRNKGLESSLRLPPGRILSKERCAELLAGVDQDGLTGGALWHDTLALNTERLVLNFLLEADFHKACLANYVKATGFIQKDNRVVGVTAKDALTGETFEITADCVVNATGPWFQKNLQESGFNLPGKKQQWCMGLNLIIKKSFFREYAVALEGTRESKDQNAIVNKGKRLYFFVPWRGYTMIGTHYLPLTVVSDQPKVQKQDIEDFIYDINCLYPEGKINFDDVTFVHGGVLPMSANEPAGDVQLEKEGLVIDHEKTDGLKGLLSIRSVKYTTAPAIADEVTKSVLVKLKKKRDINSLHCSFNRDYCRESVLTNTLECGDSVVSKSAVKHFVQNEMAAKLSDIIFRRTNIGTAECPSRECINRVADTMSDIMGWDAGRKELEIEEVLKCYEPLTLASSLRS